MDLVYFQEKKIRKVGGGVKVVNVEKKVQRKNQEEEKREINYS